MPGKELDQEKRGYGSWRVLAKAVICLAVRMSWEGHVTAGAVRDWSNPEVARHPGGPAWASDRYVTRARRGPGGVT